MESVGEKNRIRKCSKKSSLHDDTGFCRILVLNLIPCKQNIKSWYVIFYINLILDIVLLFFET